jgi:hypothetical protein
MAKGELFKQLPPWGKGVIAVGILAGVGFVDYAVYKRLKKDKELAGAKKELDSVAQATADLTKAGQKPTLDSFKLAQIANQIHSALNGYGTDENGVYRAFTNVKTDLDVVNLTKAYGIRKLSSGNWNPAPDFEGTLGQSLTEELDPKEMAALNNLIAKKGIKYRF